jgi:hypothetical protein
MDFGILAQLRLEELGAGGLLLGQAVKRAEAEDEIATGYAHNFAAGEKAGEGVEGYAIVGVIEGRNDDEFVGDVEIGVAGGEALVVEINRRWHGKSLDAEGTAVQVFHGL